MSALTARRLRAGGAAALAILATAACDRLAVPDPRPDTPVAIFDQVWTDFDRYYAFFQTDGVDWNAARTRYRPVAAAATTDRALADAIGAMLTELHDQHVTLYTPFGEYSDTVSLRASLFNPFVTAFYVSTRPTASGHLTYGRIGSDVGYVRVPSFLGTDWPGDIDEALRQLQGVRGVILDIRSNGGGNDETARQIAGRFLTADRLARYLRYRNGPAHDDFSDFVEDRIGPSGPGPFQGRVVVLTDRRAFSAAESFVLYLRGAPGVTIVGDTTGGASSRPIARELANGWTYRLSSWMEFTPQKVSYERVGLAPDSVVIALPQDGGRGLDRQLEAGIRIIRR